jgi:hypothetical protein
MAILLLTRWSIKHENVYKYSIGKLRVPLVSNANFATITLGMIGRLDALNPLVSFVWGTFSFYFILHTYLPLFLGVYLITAHGPHWLCTSFYWAKFNAHWIMYLTSMSTWGDVVVNNTMNLWSTLNIICKGIFLVCMEACNEHTKLKNSLWAIH